MARKKTEMNINRLMHDLVSLFRTDEPFMNICLIRKHMTAKAIDQCDALYT